MILEVILGLVVFTALTPVWILGGLYIDNQLLVCHRKCYEPPGGYYEDRHSRKRLKQTEP